MGGTSAFALSYAAFEQETQDLRMIVPLSPTNFDLSLPPSVADGLLKVLRQQLPVLVKLVAGPVVDLDGDLLVFRVGSDEVGAIVLRPFGRWVGEVAFEGFLAPLTFGGVATGVYKERG